MFSSQSNPRTRSAFAWARVFALALGGVCVAAPQGHSQSVPAADAVATKNLPSPAMDNAPSHAVALAEGADFCGRCLDYYDNIHMVVANDRCRFGVGPARPEVEPSQWHFFWRDGDCLWNHGICFNPSGSMTCEIGRSSGHLIKAVAQGNVAELAALVDRPEVTVDATGSAIQVLACDGQTVVARVPVSPALLEAVEDRIASF